MTLWSKSGICPPEAIEVGSDLVIAVAQEHGNALAHGTAIDDYLGTSARIAADVEARERYRRWQTGWGGALTIDGIDLTEVWEVEMLAQCFLPAARLMGGLPVALEATRPSSLLTSSLDSGTIELVRALAGSSGVAVEVGRETSPVYELFRGRPPRLAGLMNSTGLTSRVRGNLLCMPYWPVYPAIASILSNGNGLSPVAARVTLPGLGRVGTMSVALKGGWMGLPSRRARAASSARVAALIDGADRTAAEDPVDAAIDSHALETLKRLAGETLAFVEHARSAVAGSSIKLGVVPFDSEEHARMLVGALHGLEVPTLLVQHGFPARQGDPDMGLARHLAIWSEHERSLWPERDPATATVTGNPGAAHLAEPEVRRVSGSGRTVVLIDYPGRLTALIDSRVGMRHVAVALQALAAARPGTLVVLRPHPSDLSPDAYAQLAEQHPGLRVEVDAHTPIEALLGSADLCVGALSTAALQACAIGLPTVVLDVAGVRRPWPFDGTALPVGTDAESLAELIAVALAAGESEGREAALDALGARPDAVERVVDLIDRIVG
jgi:hypothetical protein